MKKIEKLEKISKERNINLIEIMLKDAREKNNWDYFYVAKKLKIDDKTVKKWEYGLAYPDLNMIYKLSELYQIPSEELVQAKTNSLSRGYASVHFHLINWLCYITSASIYVSMFLNFFIIYILAPLVALGFFIYEIQQVIIVNRTTRTISNIINI